MAMVGHSGATRTSKSHCRAFVPPGYTALQFATWKRCSSSSGHQRQEKFLLANESGSGMKLKPHSFDPLPSMIGTDDDILEKVRRIQLSAFTDEDAVFLTSPDASHGHIVERVMDLLFENIRMSTKQCVWNTPKRRPEWDFEFRLMHEWWLSLRILPCTAQLQEHYPPLIPWGERNSRTENQFFSDIALHMKKRGAAFSLLHIDHITLTPERAAVLLFDGILRNKERLLVCLSLPFCEIGAAALLVLLCSLHDCNTLQPQLRFLNLSYNWVNSSCLHMLTMMLARTSVRALSLRGNHFGGSELLNFQDFLLHGCMFLEELDLSYTCLTQVEVCAIIRCLPQLHNLHILLLDGVGICENRAVGLLTAIRQSKLAYVSLKDIPACSGKAYLERVWSICQRNRAERTLQKSQSTTWELSHNMSFFEAFRGRSSSWIASDDQNNNMAGALPALYRPFTTNEPSLL